MNALEQYKLNQAEKETYNFAHETQMRQGFEMGFDACLSLDLAVKFTSWVDSHTMFEGIAYYLDKDYNPEDLTIGIIGYNLNDVYQYWLDKVFKPE